jgi:PAS domain S-box-containing protein
MKKKLHILIAEDSESDALLILEEIKSGGYDVSFKRVETEEAFSAALDKGTWDVIISDYSMPRFSAQVALQIYNEKKGDVPFFVISGVMGEETAVEMMKLGAKDYLIKNKLSRICSAIDRELKEVEARRSHRYAEEELIKASIYLNAMPDTLIAFSKQLSVVCMNASGMDLFGYSNEEIVGLTFQKLFPEEEHQKYLDLMKKTLDTEKTTSFETMILTKNGKRIPVLLAGSVVKVKGEIKGVIGTLKDITDIKKTQQKLLYKTALLEAQSETTLDGILVVNEENHVIFYNKRFGNLWQIPKEILKKNDQGVIDDNYLLNFVKDSVVDSESFFTKVRDLYSHPDKTSFDELQLKDGRFFERYSSPLIDSGKQRHGRIWYFRDITEKKKLAERLKQYSAELELKVQEQTKELVLSNTYLMKSNNAKSDFLANMSHELRTPLNAIIGFTEILLNEKYGPMEPKQKKIETNVLDSAKHLLSLINDILDISKIEAGKLELSLSNFSLANMVDNSLIALRESALKKNIKIESQISSQTIIQADERKIKQVMYNLLTNAIKSTTPGGRIDISSEVSKNILTVSVTDTGIGIKEEDISKLFNAFSQIDNEYTRGNEGTGLGLALCKKFIELHKGAIWASSEINKGCTFSFSIPIEQPSLL